MCRADCLRDAALLTRIHVGCAAEPIDRMQAHAEIAGGITVRRYDARETTAIAEVRDLRWRRACGLAIFTMRSLRSAAAESQKRRQSDTRFAR